MVGHKIGDGIVGFMSNRRNNRRPAGMDGPGDRFGIKRLQVLEGATAADQDDHVDAARVEPPERVRDLAQLR